MLAGACAQGWGKFAPFGKEDCEERNIPIIDYLIIHLFTYLSLAWPREQADADTCDFFAMCVTSPIAMLYRISKSNQSINQSPSLHPSIHLFILLFLCQFKYPVPKSTNSPTHNLTHPPHPFSTSPFLSFFFSHTFAPSHLRTLASHTTSTSPYPPPLPPSSRGPGFDYTTHLSLRLSPSPILSQGRKRGGEGERGRGGEGERERGREGERGRGREGERERGREGERERGREGERERGREGEGERGGEGGRERD